MRAFTAQSGIAYNKMIKKRGYFFTLDAFVAMGIIVVGLFVVLASYSYSPVSEQQEALGADILLSLSATKVTELNNDYVMLLITNGTITNRDNTVLQQLGEFYVNNQSSMGSKFIANISSNILPYQFGVNISINKTQAYYSGAKLRPSSRYVISSKSIIFGIYNGTFWGPFPADVVMWQ